MYVTERQSVTLPADELKIVLGLSKKARISKIVVKPDQYGNLESLEMEIRIRGRHRFVRKVTVERA